MERKFKIVVEKGIDGYFIGEAPELPGCYSQGKTLGELMDNMREAIELYMESAEQTGVPREIRFIAIKEVVVNA
ncbi:MAG: type II toxin-antitoxin system HicB family antitoxin [Candidatus Diapherotrites archaeon]